MFWKARKVLGLFAGFGVLLGFTLVCQIGVHAHTA
jgi:hypothetical protein